MKITIGITTYNRKSYLLKCRESLYASSNIDECNIRIYDDCSSDYDIHFLRSIFQDAKSIIVNKKKFGADSNMRQMHLDFLKSNDDILVTVDSDLIFHPEWLHFIIANFSYTDGILCLYNSSEHPPTAFVDINGHKCCEKDHIGSAGTVFHKNIIKKIIDHVPNFPKSYDWKWSDYLKTNNFKLIVSNQSYFQHIGVEGQNCNMFFLTDFGLNFIPGSSLNANFLSEYVQEIMIQNQSLVEKRDQMFNDYCNATIEYKVGNFLLSPLISAKRKIMSLFLK